MADYSRVLPDGWAQGDDSAAASRVGSQGWVQIAAAGGGTTSISPSVGTLVLAGYGPAVAKSSIPFLSAATAINVTQTQATPQVALTF